MPDTRDEVGSRLIDPNVLPHGVPADRRDALAEAVRRVLAESQDDTVVYAGFNNQMPRR